MRNAITYLIVLPILLMLQAPLHVSAQDIHFSQYDLSPLNLNPAYTGFYNEDLRFILNHRNQWQSVTKPYRTFSGSVDNKVKIKNNTLAAGIVLNQDRAGDSKFGTFQLALSVAKHLLISSDSSLHIGIGLQGGLVNRSLNDGDLQFDNQYNGDVFDGSLPTGESFSNSGFIYFDISAGIVLSYRVAKGSNIIGGFSLLHLNKPKQSFFDNNEVKLNRRFNTDISVIQKVNSDFDIVPSLLFMSQGKFRESNIGIRGIMHLQDKPGNRTSVSAGVAFRVDDAAILRTGLDHNQWKLGISYDFNTSDLQVASDKKGGFEFALIYLITRVKPVNISKKICPVY